jgi:hypothetical protein
MLTRFSNSIRKTFGIERFQLYLVCNSLLLYLLNRLNRWRWSMLYHRQSTIVGTYIAFGRQRSYEQSRLKFPVKFVGWRFYNFRIETKRKYTIFGGNDCHILRERGTSIIAISKNCRESISSRADAFIPISLAHDCWKPRRSGTATIYWPIFIVVSSFPAVDSANCIVFNLIVLLLFLSSWWWQKITVLFWLIFCFVSPNINFFVINLTKNYLHAVVPPLLFWLGIDYLRLIIDVHRVWTCL